MGGYEEARVVDASRLYRGGSRLDLVGPDLLGLLSPAEKSQRAVWLQHDLGRLGIGIVVNGGHGGAICARAADHDEVADPGARHPSRRERFGIAGGRGEDVARLAAGPA